MMNATVTIDAIACSYCKDFVIKNSLTVAGIFNVRMDVKTKRLSFSYKSHNAVEGLRILLKDIGYPITEDSSLIVNRFSVNTDNHTGKLV
jgi:copper chaperone CopZ